MEDMYILVSLTNFTSYVKFYLIEGQKVEEYQVKLSELTQQLRSICDDLNISNVVFRGQKEYAQKYVQDLKSVMKYNKMNITIREEKK